MSKYSDRQEGYLQFMLASIRKYSDPVARLLQVRPAPREAVQIWNIYMLYVDILFNCGNPSPLREEFCNFVNLPEGLKPTAIQAARFAAVMAVCMAFGSQAELDQYSFVDLILDRDVLDRFKEMCPRHMACRYYLALCLSILDGIGSATIEVVHLELLSILALFNMGAITTTRARFAIMLQRAVSMGLHKDPSGLMQEPYTQTEREARLKLAFQIQHVDFVTSICLGAQPVSFDIFSFAIAQIHGLPEFCQYVMEALGAAKDIYKTFFPSVNGGDGSTPPFSQANEMTVCL